jgi:hypothetical protein
MDGFARMQKLAGISAVLLPLMSLANGITLFAAANNNSAFMSNPALLVEGGARGASLFHWSMVFDLVAYLLLAPVVLFCWAWLGPKNKPMAALYTVCGLAYSLLGSMGAVVLAALLPTLIGEYLRAPAAQQETLRLFVDFSYRAIAFGIWNPLEVLMLSIWFLGIGGLLRKERRALGIFAMIAGGIGLLDPLGWMLGNQLLFNLGALGTVLLLFWALWFGIDLLRRPVGSVAAAPAQSSLA